VDPTPARYAIRIHGHPGATVLSASPALVSRRHGADTVLTGLLDRSARYAIEWPSISISFGRAGSWLSGALAN
jgi:hypothetical protein